MKLRPVSKEFRRLHRLPFECGLLVESVDGPGVAQTLGLRPSDVIVAIGPWAVSTEADVARAAASLEGPGSALVIRVGERVLLGPDPASRPAPAGAHPPETADQVLDRLWNQAIKSVIPGGIDQVQPGKGAPEDPPEKKKPIPPGAGRK